MAYIGRPPSTTVSATAVTNTFTGNGATQFSLSRSIDGANPSLLEVFVSNVQQQPTVSYSVSGNVITFTEAPGSGEPIYVILRDYPTAPVYTIPNDSIVTAKLQDNSITSAKIQNGTILFSDIADANITAAKIQNGAVTGDKLDISAVTTTKILDGAVTTAKIADAAITSSKLAVISNVTITGGNVFNVGFTIENVISTSNVITLNYANATVFTCTATEETTITPTNFPASGVALLKLRNGGDHTITYAANAQFAAGTPPTLTASGLDHLVFEGNSTVYTVTSVLDIQED